MRGAIRPWAVVGQTEAGPDPMKRARPWLIWLGLVLAASATYNWYTSRGGLWTAWTYPTSERLNPRLIGVYETLEACRTAVQADLNRRGIADSGAYRCGRKCELRRQGFYHCAEEQVSPTRPAPADAG